LCSFRFDFLSVERNIDWYLKLKKKGSFLDIDLSDLYPQLLERLDDSQDMIRIEITKSINKFFWCSNVSSN